MNIFLTGGSGGIGRAIIRSLTGEKENTVYYTYWKTKPQADPGNAKALRCDLGNREDVRKLVAEHQDIEFDVIVNNAFEKLELKPFLKTEWDDIQHSLDVGVRSAFELTRAFAKSMKRRKQGHIITVLSAVVLEKAPAQMVPYVVAKHALLGLHNALAAELTKSGIRVNAVSPRMVQTGFIAQLPDHYVHMTADSMPNKKLLTPEDVADRVRYLVSEGPDDITGENLSVVTKDKDAV